jgi:hypothetical protein
MKRPLSQQELMVWGTCFVVVGSIAVWAVATRYEWLRRRMPFLGQWRLLWFRWPASRAAAAMGSGLLFYVGVVMLCAVVLPAWMPFIVGGFLVLLGGALLIGVRDYLHHRRQRTRE